jgi:hypothetical protein
MEHDHRAPRAQPGARRTLIPIVHQLPPRLALRLFAVLERIIDRGLIEGKRKVRIAVPIADRPGTLHALTGIIKDTGANVLQVVHDRDSEGTGITGANVLFTLETKGPAELKLLLDKLQLDFPRVKVLD